MNYVDGAYQTPPEASFSLTEQLVEMGPFTYYEFFAGGGMARAGLGAWTCLFANDHSRLKAGVYAANWGDAVFDERDIHELGTDDLPSVADMAWASFPCQDLSIAGNGLGLGFGEIGRGQARKMVRQGSLDSEKLKTRSGSFWPLIGLIRGLASERRAPRLIVLENVLGLLTSNNGRDFAAVGCALSGAGYRFGAMVIDARYFAPQSRGRVFIVALRRDVDVPEGLALSHPSSPWHSEGVMKATRVLPPKVFRDWIWWNLGKAPMLATCFADVISDSGSDIIWHTPEETERLLSLMSELNLQRVDEAMKSGERRVGSVYLRMRPENGANRQRAEVTFSPVSGCLRTPRGGASRPRILVVDGKCVRSRLLTPREASALMGLPVGYQLPSTYSDAFRVIGDGVVVPVVAFLRQRLLEPLLTTERASPNSARRTFKTRAPARG
jgi:DNA (cytosine-5)-methyltransferase 1